MTVTLDDSLTFTREVLGTGLMLVDVLSVLIEELADGAEPGKEPAEMLLEMLAGTFHPAAEAAGAEAVRHATALVGALGDRALSDLRRAATLAAARESGESE